jgi:hypothetical protein
MSASIARYPGHVVFEKLQLQGAVDHWFRRNLSGAAGIVVVPPAVPIALPAPCHPCLP